MTRCCSLAHTPGMRSRVLLVDDHAGFRAVARALLEGDGLVVVGEADDGWSAVAAAELLTPDLVLLDVHLPDMDGFAVARRLALLAVPPQVVLVSSRPLGDLRSRVAGSPVRGFLPKHELSGAALDELLAGA